MLRLDERTLYTFYVYFLAYVPAIFFNQFSKQT